MYITLCINFRMGRHFVENNVTESERHVKSETDANKIKKQQLLL
jgi:hypothetical protein